MDTALYQFHYNRDRSNLNYSDFIHIILPTGLFDFSREPEKIDISINDCYVDDSSIVYSKDGKFLITCINKDMLEDYTVRDGTTIICDYAFLFCRALKSISIPESVQAIGKGAFENCYWLSNINLPTHLNVLQAETFKGCRKLFSIHLPASLTTIGESTFESCGVGFMFFQENITCIESNAFNTKTITPPIIIVPEKTKEYYTNLLHNEKVTIQSINEFNKERERINKSDKQQKIDDIVGVILGTTIITITSLGLLYLMYLFKSCAENM